MHDIRAIRDNPAAFDAALSRRGLQGLSAQVLALDEDRRGKILAAETATADQNRASKEAGAAKGRGDEAEFERLRAEVAVNLPRLVGRQVKSAGFTVGDYGKPRRRAVGSAREQFSKFNRKEFLYFVVFSFGQSRSHLAGWL